MLLFVEVILKYDQDSKNKIITFFPSVVPVSGSGIFMFISSLYSKTYYKPLEQKVQYKPLK